MAVYEFICNDCQNRWNEMMPMSQFGKYEKIKCPKCESFNKDKVVSLCAPPVFSNPVGTQKFNDHDYRYHWNHDRPGGVRDQRKAAEAASHVGADPYTPIDDITSGEHFGEVK